MRPLRIAVTAAVRAAVRAAITVAVTVVAMVALTATGCTRQVTGTAQPDPRTPGTSLTSDGYGILTGFADAPVQLELFTEPQCDHCADFQASFGEAIKAHIEAGRLALTYRPVTFFDEVFDTDFSGLVANALFLAAGPDTSASVFQSFVETLWANQNLSYGDYGNSDIAGLARDSGIAAEIVAKIDAGDTGVDTTAMDAANNATLAEISGDQAGTPTVYNPKTKSVVDIFDNDWLDTVMKGS